MPIKTITAIAGTALPLRGNNIDTDRIIPARYLRSVSFEGLEHHLFADDREQADALKPGSHPVSDPRFNGASILIVNANFGCGSSREHAPQAIQRRGFKAIIGQSFSEIFLGNSLALGMPCFSASEQDVEMLMRVVADNPSTTIEIDLERQLAAFGPSASPGSSRAPSSGDRSQIAVTLPPAARDSFLDGSWDATGLLLERFEDVEAVARRLPYANGWLMRP